MGGIPLDFAIVILNKIEWQGLLTRTMEKYRARSTNFAIISGWVQTTGKVLIQRSTTSEFGILCCLTTPGLRKDIRRTTSDISTKFKIKCIEHISTSQNDLEVICYNVFQHENGSERRRTNWRVSVWQMDSLDLLAWSVGFMYFPLLVVLIDRLPILAGYLFIFLCVKISMIDWSDAVNYKYRDFFHILVFSKCVDHVTIVNRSYFLLALGDNLANFATVWRCIQARKVVASITVLMSRFLQYEHILYRC